MAHLNLALGLIEVTTLGNSPALEDWLHRNKPTEVLLPESTGLNLNYQCATRQLPAYKFSANQAQTSLSRHFGEAILAATGLDAKHPAIGAAAAALDYAKATQCQELTFVQQLRHVAPSQYIRIDPQSRINLEIDQRLNGAQDRTLYALLNTAVTPMGSRKLRHWLNPRQ